MAIDYLPHGFAYTTRTISIITSSNIARVEELEKPKLQKGGWGLHEGKIHVQAFAFFNQHGVYPINEKLECAGPYPHPVFSG